MLIRISIETTEPLTGTAATRGRGPLPFAGWLELLRAISDLVGAADRSGDRGPEADRVEKETNGGRHRP